MLAKVNIPFDSSIDADLTTVGFNVTVKENDDDGNNNDDDDNAKEE